MTKPNCIMRIDSIRSRNCGRKEFYYLIQKFRDLAEHMSSVHTQEAYFELKDFPSAKENDADEFSLLLKRRNVNGNEEWWGTFENGFKSLNVTGGLKCNA